MYVLPFVHIYLKKLVYFTFDHIYLKKRVYVTFVNIYLKKFVYFTFVNIYMYLLKLVYFAVVQIYLMKLLKVYFCSDPSKDPSLCTLYTYTVMFFFFFSIHLMKPFWTDLFKHSLDIFIYITFVAFKRETHNSNISIMYQYYALYHYVNIYHVFQVLFMRFICSIYGDEHVCLCQTKSFNLTLTINCLLMKKARFEKRPKWQYFD